MSKLFKFLKLGYSVIASIISGEDKIKAILTKYKEAKKDGKITLSEALGIIDELSDFLGSIWSGFKLED